MKEEADKTGAPSGHALLSPSAAKRWLACGPSALLESLEPDKAGKAAQAGTVAHECAALRLLLSSDKAEAADEEMERAVSAYVRHVRDRHADALRRDKLAMLAVETRVDLRPWIPGGFGTADAVIVADKVLEVIDLKYGDGVRVDAQDNPQLMSYALGVLAMYSGLCYDIEEVVMTIYQPRMDNVSSYAMTAEELRSWGSDVLHPGALRASKGAGDLVKGDHCKFCRVRDRCRAWQEGWEDLKALRAKHLTDDATVARVVREFDEFQQWGKQVVAKATEQAAAGKRYEGLKLVEGRRRRTVMDPAGLAKALTANTKATREDIYVTEMRTITELERLVGRKAFAEVSLPYVASVPGAAKLVPAEAGGAEITPLEDVEKRFEQYLNN